MKRITRSQLLVFRQAGAKGGKARARKLTKKQMSTLSKESGGGRPQTSRLAVLEAIKSGMTSRQAIADKTGLTLANVSQAISRLRREGTIERDWRPQTPVLSTERRGRDRTKSKAKNPHRQSVSHRKVRPTAAAD